MKQYLFIISLVLFSMIFKLSAFAQSDYVLPYPSLMPGTLIYNIHVLYESISKYWYFGSFGQFKYNLKQSDKYLVEAKTLFDYKQYLLGANALRQSNDYFHKIPVALARANEERKDISLKEKIFKEASLKHIEELRKLEKILPETFIWKPEKGNSETLYLKKILEESIQLRISQ